VRGEACFEKRVRDWKMSGISIGVNVITSSAKEITFAAGRFWCNVTNLKRLTLVYTFSYDE
jgi:hypothetical protein